MKNPYCFLKFEEEMMKKRVDLWVKHGEYVRETNEEDNEQSECSRENWKVLKTIHKAQNARFSRLNQVTNKSPSQAAKNLWDKILEKFSKCFSRMEGPPASKLRREPWKFLYNLVTGASTREQVVKPSCENFKDPEFWKIF